jgi:hypothetical protein
MYLTHKSLVMLPTRLPSKPKLVPREHGGLPNQVFWMNPSSLLGLYLGVSLHDSLRQTYDMLAFVVFKQLERSTSSFRHQKTVKITRKAWLRTYS